MALKRVVVTGIGMVSPLGLSAQESWEALLKGQSGIINIEDYLERLKQTDSQNKLINPKLWPGNTYVAPIKVGFDNLKKWKVPLCTNNANSYVMSAAEEALKDSKIEKILQENEDLQNQAGVNIGIMSSNTTKLTEIIKDTEKKGFDGLNRLTIFHTLTNMASANLSIKYKLKGPSQSASTACATGSSAIGDSFRNIQFGDAKVMLAGGSEECLNPTIIWASIRMQAMNQKIHEKPEYSSRPFDIQRSGFILGEGAGVLVLEEMEHAVQRGAFIYAEIGGYGQSSDGYHLSRPLESGNGGLRCMKKAIEQAGVGLGEIQSINCHATSTQTGDLAEGLAICQLLERFQGKCVITANKGNIGHTFGAAGAIESIFSLLSIRDGVVPKILNLQEECQKGLRFARENVVGNVDVVVKNSFGFGGVNVSLVFKKFK